MAFILLSMKLLYREYPVIHVKYCIENISSDKFRGYKLPACEYHRELQSLEVILNKEFINQILNDSSVNYKFNRLKQTYVTAQKPVVKFVSPAPTARGKS